MAQTELQHGVGYVFGIDAVTITVASVAITGNISNQKWTDGWKEEEMGSTSGSIVEGLISSQRRRTVEFDFAPSSTTRALATAEAEEFLGYEPNAVVTIAASGSTKINGTYNYKSGGTFTRTKDGVGLIGIKMEQYETTTPGTFAALAKITG